MCAKWAGPVWAWAAIAIVCQAPTPFEFKRHQFGTPTRALISELLRDNWINSCNRPEMWSKWQHRLAPRGSLSSLQTVVYQFTQRLIDDRAAKL